MNFIVLSSSRGTTFQAILDRVADGSLTARCLGLVSDREDRGCVTKARATNTPVVIVEHTKGEDRETFDKRLHEKILSLLPNEEKSDQKQTVIAAIGWLFLLSPWFVRRWKNRMLNVHPSLLPRHPGLNAHAEVLKAGETESGITIHIIDESLDTGKILMQKICSVFPDDTEETLKTRVQELEKEWYPKVLQMMHEEYMKL